MPQVPLYNGNQVRTAPLNPVRQQTPDVSSGLIAAGRAFGQIADVVDQAAVRDAQAQADKIDTDVTAGWLKWDAENRSKYQGQNAGQYEADAQAWWDKAGETYGQAATPMVKRMIGPTLGRKRNQAMGSVLSYVGAEKERFADQAAEASAQASIEFGIDNGDPAGAAARVRQISAQVGARKGWTTEQVQADQQRLLGTLHLAYITRIAETSPEAATRYFEANKQEIPAQAQVRVEEVLTKERDNQFALKFAAENADKPLSEQLTKAAEIADADRRQKTIQQIKINQGLKKAAQQERESEASDQAWQLVGQGRKVPESILSTMDGHGRVQLQEFLRQRAEHIAAQGTKPVKTDPKTLAAVYDMVRDDPQAFKDLRMEALAYKLAGSDLEQVAKLQRDMRNPDKEKDTISWNNKVTSRLEMLRINTGSGNEEKRGFFRNAAQREFEAFQARTGKKPSPQDEDQILDRLMLPGESGWFSNNAKTYAESVATGRKFTPDISSSDRDALVKSFQARGVQKPTDEQITAAYRRWKGIPDAKP